MNFTNVKPYALRTTNYAFALAALLLLGVGCVPLDLGGKPEEAALDLDAEVGMELTLRHSAFGVVGTIVEAVGKGAGRRTVTINAEDESHTSLSDLIVLSPAQFAELKENKTTHISLGLFDDSIAKGVATIASLNALLAKIPGTTPVQSTNFDATLMTVTLLPGTFNLVIDGKVATVQTIEAGNWFGRVSVLDNPDFPLVLSVRLTPAAYGPDGILSPTKTLSEGSSYEVVSLDTTPNP